MTDETIANVPILILGNKIDRPEAISEERLREMFGLYGQTTGKVCAFFHNANLWDSAICFSHVFLYSALFLACPTFCNNSIFLMQSLIISQEFSGNKFVGFLSNSLSNCVICNLFKSKFLLFFPCETIARYILPA